MREADLRRSFEERGYAGPVRLFGAREARQILARLRREQQRQPPLDWGKGWAASSPEYYALATEDRILELVKSLIGEDVLLWGASSLFRRPGQAHPWHTDIESSSPTGGMLGVWIGLRRTDRRSSLKVAPYSHRFGVTLQQVMQEEGKERLSVSDADVARWARERDERSGVVTAESGDGEALIFDGRLWHGSHNEGQHTRHAVLLQYATPRTEVRLPNIHRAEWPFELYDVPRPPCIVVAGSDVHELNRLVPGPAAKNDDLLPALTSRVHSLRLPLDQDPDTGFKPHPLFAGSTPDISKMRCHVSVLDPDRQPHLPHRHDEEELLLVLDGEATLVLEDPKGSRSQHRAERGTFAYYPAGFTHTIRNTSSAPVSYVMFKWVTDRRDEGNFLEHRLVPVSESASSQNDDSGGVSSASALDGETRYLRHLHSHVTTLQPGAGYPPHVDGYDVAIVVLQGTVETLDQRVGRDGVIFYAAGEAHGMRNPNDVPAVYLVFEFHGRHSNSGRLKPRTFPRRLWQVARDPRLLRQAVAERAGGRVAAVGRRLGRGERSR